MDTNERKSDDAAQEMEDKLDEREAGRLEAEQGEQVDLNQGIQTGTHDAFHPGIKWGASYRVKKSTGNTE